MPYHEMMLKPMREEVTRLGVKELKSIADVDAALGPGEGTAMVFVNSVCGCAAGAARPEDPIVLPALGDVLEEVEGIPVRRERSSVDVADRDRLGAHDLGLPRLRMRAAGAGCGREQEDRLQTAAREPPPH